MTKQQMLDTEVEIIPIFDVVDELSSCSFQVNLGFRTLLRSSSFLSYFYMTLGQMELFTNGD